MRKCIYLSLSVCFFLNIIIEKNSFAQAVSGDSIMQSNALNNPVALYYSSLGEQSGLYNGPEYYFYDPHTKGSAYFLDDKSFAPGSVYYDGVQYKGVPMLYDLFSDKVVVLLYNHFSKFSLIKERVQNFDFLNHHYININTDSLKNNSSIKSGFYDELYKGKLEVLVKRAKDIQTSPNELVGPESFFNLVTRYYLKKNNTYYNITSQGSLIDVLKDRKKELQQYIRANQIKFRRAPEEAMVKIASYYDHLTN